MQAKVSPRTKGTTQVSFALAQRVNPNRQGRSNDFPQIIPSHHDSEHFPSDPADWSLLSRTLPEVFRVTLPSFNAIDDNKQVSLGSLGVSSCDIVKLREIVLFPEDPADFLFSITVNYLLQASISDDAFSVIINSLARLSGCNDHSQMSIPTTNVSDSAIFADIQISLFANLRVPLFSYPNLIVRGEDINSTITWGDVAKTTERDIIEHLGFTVKGLNAIKYFWKLKDQAVKIKNILLKGLPAEVYSDFGQLMDAFVHTVGKNEREYTVLKGRFGLLGGRKWTLEELGKREGLTRERIRQIEKKLMSILEKPNTLERLSFLWFVVDETLTASGGVCCIVAITESLRNGWMWATLPSEEGLASLIHLSAKYKVVWSPPIRIMLPNYKCINCAEIGPVLTRAVESQPNGTLPFEDANAAMLKYCHSHACPEASKIVQFTKGFFQYLDDVIEEILADENTLYTPYAWAQKYGNRRLQLVETILRNAGRAMHFTEVHAEINKDRPEHGEILERNVHAYLDRSPDVLLWDRGTYIHREFVSIPHDLVAKIEEEILCRLDCDIPYLSVNGIYKLFNNELVKKNISSESALYSCLRESANQKLKYPKYPNIMKDSIGIKRLPITLVLEMFVLNQEGTVSYEELRDYAVNTLCVNEAVFVANHLKNIPNLLRVNRGEYIHLNQLTIEESRLVSIVDHLRTLLSMSNHVSTIKLYNDKKITCKLLGISTPMLLFSLIQFFYSDQFDLSRYPKICLAGHMVDGNRTTGVATEVIRYITEKGTPCSFAELYQYFVDELGYKQASVYNIHFNRQVIRYSEGVVVVLESLDWTEEKQAALEMLAANHLSNRESVCKPFGLISHLYEYSHDKLPEITDQISWTPTLIGELLSRSGRYRIIGTPRDAFVPIPNSRAIESLDDLLNYILEVDYDGAANIDQFISDMRDAGILRKSLTSIMLGEDSHVVIEGNVVRLARLK